MEEEFARSVIIGGLEKLLPRTDCFASRNEIIAGLLTLFRSFQPFPIPAFIVPFLDRVSRFQHFTYIRATAYGITQRPERLK